jgi:acyl carrier protein
MEIVRAALTDLNRELQYESLENVNEDTVVFGDVEGIDSLSLVGLLTDLERRVKDSLGGRVTLTDERAFTADPSPFASAGELARYIADNLAQG